VAFNGFEFPVACGLEPGQAAAGDPDGETYAKAVPLSSSKRSASARAAPDACGKSSEKATSFTSTLVSRAVERPSGSVEIDARAGH
jgi:hypothetical protein